MGVLCRKCQEAISRVAGGVMKGPMFSIVVANYNYGKFIGDAIKSAFAQTYTNFEVIICDAASTDDSVEVIKRFAAGLEPNTERSLNDAMSNGSHITWWCSEKDKGQSEAFNKGFSHAKGRFLTWLNADDLLYPKALESIAKLIEQHADNEWFVGSTTWVDSSLNVKKCFCAHRFSVLRATYAFMTACGPSSFFSRDLYEAVGRIDESLHYLMDTDLWYKFYLKCGAKYLRTKDDVWIFRVHDASKTTGSEISDSAIAAKNRIRYVEETNLVADRYRWPGKWQTRLFTVLSFSLWDKIIAMCRTIKRKDKQVSMFFN